jgi:hypothetical protein
LTQCTDELKYKENYRMKIRIISAVLLALVALAGSVGTTFAATNGVIDVRLAPGATLCITPATPNVDATTLADASGTANAGGATFVVYNGSPTATNPIYTAATSAGFHAIFTPSLPMGAVFPGKFKLCATNPSSVNNTRITMSITVN